MDNSNKKMKNISKKLLKNNIFWWNLLPAISTTVIFFLFKRDVMSYIVGCFGILNWLVVIVITIRNFYKGTFHVK